MIGAFKPTLFRKVIQMFLLLSEVKVLNKLPANFVSQLCDNIFHIRNLFMSFSFHSSCQVIMNLDIRGKKKIYPEKVLTHFISVWMFSV